MAKKCTDPAAELISKDEDGMHALFTGMAQRHTDGMRQLLDDLRRYRDAGLAARRDAIECERIAIMAIETSDAAVTAIERFIAAVDQNQALPLPMLREQMVSARQAALATEFALADYRSTRPGLQKQDESPAIDAPDQAGMQQAAE